MKILTDQQLKTASIVDLTDDVELMRKALDSDSFVPEDVKFWSDHAKITSLISYAGITEDTKLLNRLYKLFGEKIDAFYSE
jgi:hypothetical protein